MWNRLEEASIGQEEAVRRVRGDLRGILNDRFVTHSSAAESDDPGPLEFVQTFFFLILFRSILQSVGVQRACLDFYSELNFCIQGTVVAADNLFDGERKSLLPLRTGAGHRFGSILQLLAFQRLMARVFERAVDTGLVSGDAADLIQRELLSRMADIGALEGSEEAGVEELSDVETMVERVHRVRGGQLFELSVIAPSIIEPPERRGAVVLVRRAISRLGTAFQIVDDLTDLEFDVRHGRQNLLAAQIHQAGTREERAALGRLRETDSAGSGLEPFVDSAKSVLERARIETRRSLEELAALGFWWPPRLADELVCSIVGLDGLTAMEIASADIRPHALGART